MTTSTIKTHYRSREVAAQVAATKVRIRACYPVKRSDLTGLNVAVFHHLYKSGTSRELICRKLKLTCDEFKQVEILMAL